MLAAPTLGGGWLWDVGNGIGFGVLAGLIFLALPVGRISNFPSHELFAKVVLALCVIHATWFLVLDPALVTYITPGRAPAYMLAGIAALVLLLCTTVMSERPARARWFTGPAFRQLHRWGAVFVLVGAGYHVLASGFYISAWYEIASLLFVCALAGVLLWRQPGAADYTEREAYLMGLMALVSAVAFAAIRNVEL